MAEESKSTMVSVRLPTELFARLEHVANNTDAPGIKNRSTAVQAAIKAWLPGQETRLAELGLLPKKARQTA